MYQYDIEYRDSPIKEERDMSKCQTCGQNLPMYCLDAMSRRIILGDMVLVMRLEDTMTMGNTTISNPNGVRRVATPVRVCGIDALSGGEYGAYGDNYWDDCRVGWGGSYGSPNPNVFLLSNNPRVDGSEV
jgi:hypothetical protein